MANWTDVERIAASLPETGTKLSWGNTTWTVKGKGFVWDRPLRAKELAEVEFDDPDEPILAFYVPDEGAKTAIIADEPDIYFTVSHMDGYPIVLAHLGRLEVDDLEELMGEAWLCRAPARIRKAYLEAQS